MRTHALIILQRTHQTLEKVHAFLFHGAEHTKKAQVEVRHRNAYATTIQVLHYLFIHGHIYINEYILEPKSVCPKHTGPPLPICTWLWICIQTCTHAEMRIPRPYRFSTNCVHLAICMHIHIYKCECITKHVLHDSYICSYMCVCEYIIQVLHC